jgi:hypothetical protein
MTDEWTTERWETAIRTVFRRALEDPAFRALAKSDPRQAFARANGVPAPEQVKFRFVEALDEHVLVLPKVAQPFGALSEIDVSRILHHSMRQQSIPPTMTPTA